MYMCSRLKHTKWYVGIRVPREGLSQCSLYHVSGTVCMWKWLLLLINIVFAKARPARHTQYSQFPNGHIWRALKIAVSHTFSVSNLGFFGEGSKQIEFAASTSYPYKIKNVFHFLSIIAHGLILSNPISEYTSQWAQVYLSKDLSLLWH